MEKRKKLYGEEKYLYESLVEFMTTNRYSPSIRELATITGIPGTTVFRRLHSLRRKRYIDFKDKARRTISLVDYELIKKHE